MVKIKRGSHETFVSMESYKNIFKPLGYILEEENKKVIEVAPKKTEVSVKDTKRKKKQED